MSEMGDKGGKGEGGMTVNREPYFSGRAESGKNLVRVIPQTHLPFLKLAGVELWILWVDYNRSLSSEIDLINPWLLGEKCKPIIICVVGRTFLFWAYFGFRKTCPPDLWRACPSSVFKIEDLSAILLEGLALTA
jgi:hypothetical protein